MTIVNADLNAIVTIRDALEAAENAGDADAVATLLSDDAVVMVPDFPVTEGKTACTHLMRDIMAWLFEQFDRRITYVSDEVAIIGDMAFDRGTFAFTVSPKSGGESAQVTGKYLWLLSRTPGGEWRVARLIVSRDDESDEEAAHESRSSVPDRPDVVR